MCTNGHLKINLPYPAKLLLEEIFLKIKSRKFIQKCLTPEKIFNSSPVLTKVLLTKTFLNLSTLGGSNNEVLIVT